MSDPGTNDSVTKPEPCDYCGGSGKVLRIRPTTAMGMAAAIVAVACPECSPGVAGHDD